MAVWTIASSKKKINGTSTGTSDAHDTSSASTVVVTFGGWITNQDPAISDNKSNTWTTMTVQDAVVNSRAHIYVCNLDPSKRGTGHTFTLTVSVANIDFSMMGVVVISGADTTSPIRGESGQVAAAGTGLSPGSLGQAGDMVVFCATADIGTGFGVSGGNAQLLQSQDYDGATEFGCAMGVDLGPSDNGIAAAVFPIITWSSSANCAAAAVAIIPAAGGGGGVTYPQLERSTRGMSRGLVHASPYPQLRRSKGGILYRESELLRAA